MMSKSTAIVGKWVNGLEECFSAANVYNGFTLSAYQI